MTHRPGHEERRLAQGDDAVGEHVPALAVDQCNRQALLEILARHHLVKAILCEEIGPALELALVESVTVSAIEIGQTRAQLHRDVETGCCNHLTPTSIRYCRESGRPGRAIRCRISWTPASAGVTMADIAPASQSPMTPRQCS